MKVRIGVAIGGRLALDDFGPVLDSLDELRFDSIWLPETFLAGTIDPLVGLGYAAARVRRLKLGAHVVGPGRNTFAMAKSLAQLDRLSAGRLLLTFVAGVNDPLERTAQGWPTGDRTGWFDTELPRLRALWAGDEVDGLRLDSAPAQSPLEVWLGGQTPAALARVGRIADGWLPGALTVDQAVEGKVAVDHAAADADRAISPEHFGINLSYTLGDSLPAVAPRLRAIGDTTDVIAIGRGALRALVGRWVEAGFSKIVVRPIAPPTDWTAELAALAEEIDGLQT